MEMEVLQLITDSIECCARIQLISCFFSMRVSVRDSNNCQRGTD